MERLHLRNVKYWRISCCGGEGGRRVVSLGGLCCELAAVATGKNLRMSWVLRVCWAVERFFPAATTGPIMVIQ